MFSAGMLTPQGAALLTEMARGYLANGFRIGVTSYPLTVSRPGRLQGTIVGIDPKAIASTFFAEITGSGSGSGSGSGVDGDRLAYSWVERVEVRAGAWANGPRSGELNAYVAEPRAGWVGVVDAGTVVEMRPSPTVSGVYEFLPECCGDGSGSGGQITVITDICLDGAGGGYVRKGIIDIDTRSIIFEWCEPIGACGSGSGGGLCPDVPSGSGSGSVPMGGTVTCCDPDLQLAATIYLPLSGGNGTLTLVWDGSTYWQSAAVVLPCGETVEVRFGEGCVIEFRVNAGVWTPGTVDLFSLVCAPFSLGVSLTIGGGCGTLTGTLSE